jgi:hypothetical protein
MSTMTQTRVHLEMFRMQTATHNERYNSQTSTHENMQHTHYAVYQKMFHSVPHIWLIKVLEIHKISPELRNILKLMMSTWRTNLWVNNKNSGTLNISSVIFQGDLFSPIWFCLALNPMLLQLNTNETGYKLNIFKKRLLHSLYMGDLKLHTDTQEKLQSLTDTVNFSNDNKITFGFDKCTIINIRKGKIENQHMKY